MKITFPSRSRGPEQLRSWFREPQAGTQAAHADKVDQGRRHRALAASRFKGQADEHLTLLAPAGLDAHRLILQDSALLPSSMRHRPGDGWPFDGAAEFVGEKEASLPIEAIPGAPLNEAEIAANIAYGARLRSYRFDKYKTKENPNRSCPEAPRHR